MNIYNRPDTNGDNNFMYKAKSCEAVTFAKMKLKIRRRGFSEYWNSRGGEGQSTTSHLLPLFISF